MFLNTNPKHETRNAKQQNDNRMTIECQSKKRKEVQSSPHNELYLFQPKEVGCEKGAPTSDQKW